MRHYKKLVSLLLVGALTFGNGQITAKAADFSTDELSVELTDISDKASSTASSGLSDDLILDEEDDSLVFSDDLTDESEDAASLSSTETGAGEDEASFEATDDFEISLIENSNDLEKSLIKKTDDLDEIIFDDTDDVTEDDTDDDLPEELPEDFYTEYPTGGVIDLEPLVDIESYSNGRRGLLQADYLDSYYVTPDLPKIFNKS